MAELSRFFWLEGVEDGHELRGRHASQNFCRTESRGMNCLMQPAALQDFEKKFLDANGGKGSNASVSSSFAITHMQVVEE